ncbi:MAG: apiosidase-like domain-containing protein [Pirellulaceae bacterium]
MQPHQILLVGLIVLPMLLSACAASQSAWATETVVPAVSSLTNSHGSALQVSENGRHLIDRDGKPFFWLGDTAWLLFQMTTREDAELYLKTRAEQGFTVIQAAVVMGEERVGGTVRPNVYGDVAFVDGNPAHPLVTPGSDVQQADAWDYWDHVDYIIERAAAHRLTLGLLPLFVGYNGDGYKYLTPDRAYDYGLFLGRRYRNRPHLLWILGGDNTPDTEAKRKVWYEVARGITMGAADQEDYRQTLMTYHINGNNSSSQWFHEAPWLDLNMIQVWGNEKEIYPKIVQDYQLPVVRPTGLGEGSYEDGPQYSTKPIDALKVRKQAYWSYLAGGYHTYGNTNTWNFSSYKAEGTQDWKQALQSPGAAHLSVLTRIFASLEWWTLIPDTTVFVEGLGSGETRNAAMRSTAGDRLLIYLSHPGTVSLRLDGITTASAAQASWVDPQTGTRTVIGKFPVAGKRSLSTPQDWPDAILLVEAKDDAN